MDHNLVSGIVNALPIDKMVAAPVMAAVQAQKSISAQLASYVNEVGLDDKGNVRMVTFKYNESVGQTTGADGKVTPQVVERFVQAPFLALTGVPNFAMEDVHVTFDLEVSTAEDSKSTTNVEAKTEVQTKSWFSPVTAKFTGSVSHASEQTRHSDTRAKYHFDVSARRQAPPEGLMRIIDAITNAAAKPTETLVNKDNLIDKEPEATPATPQTPVTPGVK